MNSITTIEEGKQYLRDNWEQGVNCPCCKQNVKLYAWKLSFGTVRGLIELYNLTKNNPQKRYFHISEIDAWRGMYGGGTFAKSAFFGLVEPMPNDDDGKRTSGMWAITNKGKDFVEGNITVPSHVLLFDMKSYGFKGKEINVKQALGNKFDYAELMGGF